MTFSQFQFLPIRVLQTTTTGKMETRDQYRLLKFTDARDPRHQHLYQISGSLIENYASQTKQKRTNANGRLLEFTDNWCLLSHNITEPKQWNKAPYPHRGHIVLYVPGHWGSFSQARSIGAHGTRWTGRSNHRQTSFIYNSFKTGEGMNDGANLNSPKAHGELLEWVHASSILDDFVMDVYSLDFAEEGATLHASRLLRQAEFFARSIETLVQGCDIDKSSNGVTIVAHSIGAWVVRIALRMHPQLAERKWIRNVVTLASPLGGVPYAVDAGVHDIISHVNNGGFSGGDVTFISISGGLRDEMIPPEVCEIPFTSFDQKDDNTTSAASETFLATTILKRYSDKSTEKQYGMDHRAIAWCHGLLEAVREVIFTLAVTTCQGMKSNNRLNMARRVMLEHHSGSDEHATTRFQQDIDQQSNLLVTDRGYVKAAAIQLAAPYNLNSLLKLAIAASLLNMHVLAPLKLFLGAGIQSNADGSGAILLEASKSLLVIPLFILSLSIIRRARSMCCWQECQVLLATSFALAQVATIIYVLICIVLSPLIANGLQMCPRKKAAIINGKNQASKSDETLDTTFSAILLQFMVKQCHTLIFFALPLIIGCIFYIHFVNGNTDDLVLNGASVGSYCFISMILLLLCCLIKSIVTITGERERSAVFVLLLMTIKTTHGKVLYALSSTTQSGQISSILYDEFLKATKSHVGAMARHHNELILCLITKVLPAFFTLNAILAYATMDQKARQHFSSSSNNSNDDGVLYVSPLAKKDRAERSWSLNMAKSSLTIL